MAREFQKHLVPQVEAKPPWPKSHEVLLEIGAGRGWNALRMARENPHSAIIAIEKTANKARAFHQRLIHHPEVKNLIFIHGSATTWVTHWVPELSLDGVVFYYPNLEIKRPNQRWFRSLFFGELLKKIKPHGWIALRTNSPEYLSEAKDWATGHWGLQREVERRVLGPPQTHFEKKFLLRGEACFEIVLTKPGGHF